MKKIIAIQSNKLNEINIETDTTFLLALEAQKKGYQIIWYETKDLNLINSKIYINGIKVRFFDRKKNTIVLMIKTIKNLFIERNL